MGVQVEPEYAPVKSDRINTLDLDELIRLLIRFFIVGFIILSKKCR